MQATRIDHIRLIIQDLDKLLETEWVAIDTETTGLHIYQDDHMLGMSLAYPGEIVAEGEEPTLVTWYVSAHHPDGPNFSVDGIVEALNSTRARQVYHHAEFDWAVLAKEAPHFVVPAGRFWDTQTVDWLLDENQPHGLKDAASRAFGYEAKDKQRELKAAMKGPRVADVYRQLREARVPHGTSPKGTAAQDREEARRIVAEQTYTWATIPARLTHEYAEMDTELTWKLREHQSGLIKSDHLGLDVSVDMEREFAFQVVLYDMMRVGIKVNPLAATRLRRDALARLEELRAMFPPELNLGSAPQLAKLVYEEWGAPVKHRTDKGAPSTSREALEELEGEHPMIEYLLEYRRLAKDIGTYYNGLLEHRDAGDRIHSSFAMNRTVTGRLSSSDPNLQNIPRADTSPEVRSVFVAEPGLELWEFDLSQAELRVMASFVNEEVMIAQLEGGRDLHAETAESIWGPGWRDMPGPDRRVLAKNVGYGYPYGIGPKKVARYLVKGTGQVITQRHIAEAARILDGYKMTYPALARGMGGLERQAKSLGYVPLHVPGRYRRYKGPGYRIWETYTALNSIVQGGVGEYMKDLMLAVSRRPEHGGGGFFRMCIQVHDSLVCEVVPGTGPAVGELLQGIADAINPFRMRMTFDFKQWGVEK